MLSIARYGTRDLVRAKQFYNAIIPFLGAGVAYERPEAIAYKGPGGGMFMVGTPFEGEATAGNGTQVGFVAPDRAAVDAAHAKAIELGGKSEGAPGVRGPEERGFYACYFRDLDGNKIMIYHAPGA
jgi:catechol 2,3-dioxygenase-like lactoylglutathione lyase family enzyme